MIRVLLAYGLPLFRVGLRATVAREQDICIVGEAVEQEVLLALFSATSPDVVLFDGDQPDCRAVELVAHLRQQGAHGIMVFTAHPGEEALFRFLMGGAAAYESARLSGADLLERIRRVAVGEYLISGVLLPPAPIQPTLPAPCRPHVAPQAPRVTRREQEILQHLLRCRSNAEIATALKIANQTVRIHLTAIFRKLGVPDRTAAIVMALRYGFVSLDDVQEGDGALKAHAFLRGRFPVSRSASREMGAIPTEEKGVAGVWSGSSC